MKKVILIMLVLAVWTSNAQTDPLLGVITKEDLQQPLYNEWFQKEYKSYVVHEKLLKAIKKDLKQYTIKVFMGTWCGDSKREVPRFIKSLEAAKFPVNQLEIIAVARKGDRYKKSPGGEEVGLNVHRVPTFIVYKNGQEINRIVEHPQESMERDLVKIVSNQSYSPRYNVVSFLEQQLKNRGVATFSEEVDELLPRLAEYTQGSRELNTYGFVKMAQGAIAEAIFIFEINAKLYPLNSNCFDSLGEAYYKNRAYTKAKKCYYKVLHMDPSNENAKEMLATIDKESSKTDK